MEKRVFTSHTKVFALISVGIILVAVIMTLFGAGLNIGIDFTGGSQLVYEMGEEFETGVVEGALIEIGINDFQVVKAGIGDVKTQLQIRTRDMGDEGAALRASLLAKLAETYPNVAFVDIKDVGPVAGRDLIKNAVLSCLVVFACMLVYIGIRFDFYSGFAALVALAHDILIMLSFMVFFSGLYQVGTSFIAAMLTIIGYSINNTIIIFDRIRENSRLSRYKGKPRMEIVESSVREILSRTINTTLTSLFTLVALYILGVTSIREFVFPLIVGMLAGVYSSVFLSSQLCARWQDNKTFAFITNIFRSKKSKKA